MHFHKIALLVDGENINPSAIDFVISEASKFGKISIKRIYGDWSSRSMSRWFMVATKFALSPKQVSPSVKGKNCSDTALVIDAMDILHKQPQIDGFCIVSSDSDFTGLAHRIRENGTFVMGIGRKHTSMAFVRACDSFSYIESPLFSKLTDSENAATTDSMVPDEKEGESDIETFKVPSPTLEGLKVLGKVDLPPDKRYDKKSSNTIDMQMIDAAFDSVVDRSTGLALCSKLGEMLKKIYKFNVLHHGFDSLKSFLKSLEPHYKLVRQADGLTFSIKKQA